MDVSGSEALNSPEARCPFCEGLIELRCSLPAAGQDGGLFTFACAKNCKNSRGGLLFLSLDMGRRPFIAIGETDAAGKHLEWRSHVSRLGGQS